MIFTLIFLLLLAYHTYTDMKSFLLYDKVTLALAAVGIVRAVYYDMLAGGRDAQFVDTFGGEFSVVQGIDLANAFYGAAVLLAIMLVIYFASRGGMGEGDVKLAPALGLWLGVEPGLVCLLLAFVGGGIVGLVLLACGRRQMLLPFGPFLCAGAVAAYFWGARLVRWYWGIW